jgi:hypothetical protein
MARDTAANLAGGCQCGAVRYRITAEPTGVNVCHCRMCQKAGGGPFMVFGGVQLDELVWTRGEPKVFVSSSIAERGFCSDCGTPLTYRMFDRDRISITLGSLDDPSAVPPTIQYGVESRLAWLSEALARPEQKTSDWLKFDEKALGNRQHPDHAD